MLNLVLNLVQTGEKRFTCYVREIATSCMGTSEEKRDIKKTLVFTIWTRSITYSVHEVLNCLAVLLLSLVLSASTSPRFF